jgi:lysophospholipase L1-like esterase
LQTGAVKEVDLVLVGDSLAQAFDASTLRPLSVINLGVGGDKTQNALYRLSLPHWSKIKPRNVVIILGTNNLSSSDRPCAIIAGLEKVIARIAVLWPSTKIIFLDIPPRGDRLLAFNSNRMEVNTAIGKLHGVTAINVDDEITCGWQVDACKNYHSDNLHFAAGGYRVVAAAIKRAVGR